MINFLKLWFYNGKRPILQGFLTMMGLILVFSILFPILAFFAVQNGREVDVVVQIPFMTLIGFAIAISTMAFIELSYNHKHPSRLLALPFTRQHLFVGRVLMISLLSLLMVFALSLLASLISEGISSLLSINAFYEIQWFAMAKLIVSHVLLVWVFAAINLLNPWWRMPYIIVIGLSAALVCSEIVARIHDQDGFLLTWWFAEQVPNVLGLHAILLGCALLGLAGAWRGIKQLEA